MSNFRIRDNKPFVLGLITLNVVIAGLMASFLLAFGNTLANNGNWYSEKTKMFKHVSLSQTYMHSRQALAHNRLNLGAWNGYQEIIHKRPVSLKEIEFDYFLDKDAYLVFIFNKTDDFFNGIRISNDEMFDNLFFKADRKGKFIDKKAIENWRTDNSSWHHAKIIFNENKFTLFVDGHTRVEYSVRMLDKSYFGFKSGQNKVLVDNVVAKDPDGNIFREDFSNNKDEVLVFGVIFIVLFLALLWILGFIKKREPDEKNVKFSLISMQMVLLVIVLIFWVYDSMYQQIRYPSQDSLEDEENFFVSKEKDSRLKEIKKEYKEDAGKDVYRIMLLGTSQTWGEGAEKKEDAIDKVIEKELDKEMGGSNKYQCINVAIRGETSKELFELYEKEFIKFHPKILIINLSNNDPPAYPEDFANNLNKFIDINNKNGIETVFIYEANSPEHRNELFLISIMREVTAKNNKLGIDMNAYLHSQKDTGFIWWDNVHMTSYGQELFAKKVVSEIKNIIRR